MSVAVLTRHRAVWRTKPVLRALYAEWYRALAPWLAPGRTVEIGGGTGNLKETLAGAWCTDIVPVPWLDAVADAQHLPFQAGSLANIVLFDALHHIEQVTLFFDEAVRTLTVGGRIIVMDPYISWLSWPVYRYVHPEPVDLAFDPLASIPPSPDRIPFDGNQAMGTLLFERHQARFRSRYPQLSIRHVGRCAFFAYPLSGGFDHPSLLPPRAVSLLLKAEQSLERWGKWLAFRMLVVLEKQTRGNDEGR